VSPPKVNAVHIAVEEVNAVHIALGEVNAVYFAVEQVNAVYFAGRERCALRASQKRSGSPAQGPA
jgi:hypothetical protein